MISISPKKVIQVLVLVILFLTVASVAGQFYKYFGGHGGNHMTIVKFFDLDSEANLPTWYSTTTLLICSILLAVVACSKKCEQAGYFFHWAAMSIIFLAFSLDEAASIHEMTIEPLKSVFPMEGIFHFTWVIPGAASVVIFGLAYLRFLADLPAKTRWLFVTAGAIFISGALGIEMVSGYYADLFGEGHITYALITTVEELLEMLGIAVFIYSLLSYIELQMKEVRLCIGSPELAAGADSLQPVKPTFN